MIAQEHTLNRLSQILNLRADEAQTLGNVIRYCSANGIGPSMATAMELAGSETVMVPGMGGMPGWVVGFAACWANGAARFTLAQGNVIIAGLRKLQREAGQSPESDHEAIYALRTALVRGALAKAA